MALRYVTTQHLPLGAGGALLPPGTEITDASTRNLTRLLADGQVSVVDDAIGGGGDGVSTEDMEAAIASAVSDLVDGSPGALDTLNELAAALGDDEAFASTVTTALGTKLEADDLADTAIIPTTATVASITSNAQALNGNTARYYEVTLDDDCAFTVSNLDTGEAIVLYLVQDGTGGYAPSFTSPLTDAGADVVGDLATDANSAHLLTLLQTSDGLAVLVAASSLA